MTIDPTLGEFKNLTPELAAKIQYVARRLEVDADLLAAVIAFETGYSFSPSARNKLSGATGLIQFIEPTARFLGTSTAELAKMTAVEQMYYVEKMLRPMNPFNDAESLYMSVFAPKYRYAEPDDPVYSSPTAAYRQNKPLDWNKDGTITVAEASKPVKEIYARAKASQKRRPFPDTPEVVIRPSSAKADAGGTPAALLVLAALAAGAIALKSRRRR